MSRARLATTLCLALTFVVAGPVSADPVAPVPQRLTGHCMDHVPTHDKVVALTFDAGGGPGALHRILETLSAATVPATFFITGAWARDNPHRVRRIARLGHAIGNHSNTHPDMARLDDAAFRRQVTRAERAIARSASIGPWFRFPYGRHTAHDVALLNGLGYACIQWTVDTAGWLGTSGGWSVDKVIERVLGGARRGEVVLMHVGANPKDGSTLDADALPQVIEALRARGYGFVSLDSLLDPVA